MGRVISSANNLGDNLDEDLELEEEVPLEDDVEDGRLVAEEERERGRISKWNYVVYLRACGLTFGLGYLFCALLGQGDSRPSSFLALFVGFSLSASLVLSSYRLPSSIPLLSPSF